MRRFFRLPIVCLFVCLFVFSQENRDFPYLHFSQWKKALLKIIFAVNLLFVSRLSKYLRHDFGQLGCKGMEISHFVGYVSGKR